MKTIQILLLFSLFSLYKFEPNVKLYQEVKNEPIDFCNQQDQDCVEKQNSEYYQIEEDESQIKVDQSFIQQDSIIYQKEVEEIMKQAKERDPKFDGFDALLVKNRIWAAQTLQKDPQYFSKYSKYQKPKYLWIGCSDSRVPSNTVVGLKAGDLFVHRNVGNLAQASDINAMAVIQYAVDVLKIQHVIVAGHYGCGAIKAALSSQDFGGLQSWLSHIRHVRLRYIDQLKQLNEQERWKRLIELNVKEQVYNIALMPVVQHAWKKKHSLTIHGVVYDIDTGILKDLNVEVGCYKDLPEDHRIYITK